MERTHGAVRGRLMQAIGMMVVLAAGDPIRDSDLNALDMFVTSVPRANEHRPPDWEKMRDLLLECMRTIRELRHKFHDRVADCLTGLRPHAGAPILTDSLLSEPIVFEFPPNGKKNGRPHLPSSRPFLIQSARMRDDVWRKIEYVAPKDDVPVLFLGETGTGKTEAAKVLVAKSPRKDKAYLHKNCAAIPEALLENELFGHEKGAYTGAATTEKGALEVADGGTLFLDEIGEMSPALQAKLLNVLQHGAEYTPIGSHEPKQCNVRFIFATHQDLRKLIEAGKFREDLFHRINRFPVRMPSLHERADMPHLTLAVLHRLSPEAVIHESCGKLLLASRLNGNIRELEGLLEKALFLADMEKKPDNRLELTREVMLRVLQEEGVQFAA